MHYRRTAAFAIALLAGLLGLAQFPLFAAEPSSYGNYLPLALKAANTPTASPTPVPTATLTPTATAIPTTVAPAPQPTTTPTPVVIAPPRGTCATNAPAPAEGAQAWAVDPQPSQNSNETICVRLIVGGQAISGATVSIDVKYKTTTSTYSGSTGSDGVASLTFGIGRATVGYTVQVVATARSGGQTYRAQTSFTPQ